MGAEVAAASFTSDSGWNFGRLEFGPGNWARMYVGVGLPYLLVLISSNTPDHF